MPKPLSEIAKSIGQSVKACSVVRLHGANVFPPGDVIYQLTAARAEGEALLVLEFFLAMTGERPKLEIHDPKGCRVVDGNLEVKSASKVTWAGAVDEPPAKLKPVTPAVFVGN